VGATTVGDPVRPPAPVGAAAVGDPPGGSGPDTALGVRETGRALCSARRAVLLGFAAAGAVAVTGCGGDEQPASNTAATPAGLTPAPPSASPDLSLEPFPGADGGGSGLVKTSEVPVGGGVQVEELLIAQPQRGVFKAFDATCPHQGIEVDAPIGGADHFLCPGHNSKFRLSDGGRISGPAPRGLSPVAVKVKDGYVVRA
jgi:nitrite reductase/ring-hydroxylating ferredoxin subunit